MFNFEELENFINTHIDNWQSLLKQSPYELKSITQHPDNPDWYILMYNLFARSSLKEKLVLETRGTCISVADGKCKIISAPFIKFFNYGEDEAVSINFKNPETFCLEKRDGWNIKLSKYDGKPYWFSQSRAITDSNPGIDVDSISRNGLSFKNIKEVKDYAAGDMSWFDNIPEGATLCLELESAWNKIHTESQIEPKLWLTMYREPDGHELKVADAKMKYGIPYDIPKEFKFSDWKSVKEELSKWKGTEHEGVVVCEPCANGVFKRVKIKCDDYLRIKMAESGFVPTTRNIFNIVVMQEFDDVLDIVGPEVKAQILEMVDRIQMVHDTLEKIYNEMMSSIDSSKDIMFQKIDAVNWVKSHYGFINYGILLSAVTSDFNTEWVKLIESWKRAPKTSWKKFVSFEESFKKLENK